MKKLFPILIGLGLTGFSAMSQAENLMQVYQQARAATLTCVNQQPIVMLHSRRSMKHVAHYCLSLVWAQIILTPMAIATATA